MKCWSRLLSLYSGADSSCVEGIGIEEESRCSHGMRDDSRLNSDNGNDGYYEDRAGIPEDSNRYDGRDGDTRPQAGRGCI